MRGDNFTEKTLLDPNAIVKDRARFDKNAAFVSRWLREE
jgi:hypothetical protein